MTSQPQQFFNTNDTESLSSDIHRNDYSNTNRGNVDDVTDRLGQMNVSTTSSSMTGGLSNQFVGSNSDEDQTCMTLDDENMQPNVLHENSQYVHREHQRASVRAHAQCLQNDSNILIVTNVDSAVFSDPMFKLKFESLFNTYDARITFRYLKSFKRVRLDFSSSNAAKAALLNLNNYTLGNTAVKCYFAQMIRPNADRNSCLEMDDKRQVEDDDEFEMDDGGQSYRQQQQNNTFLGIPRQSKQFLISPPVSPPTGWKPHEESSPCIDIQLISAIANLAPGQVHEIHPGSESQPGIFVEVCEDADQYDGHSAGKRSRIPKTANPIAAARAAIGRQAMRI